MKNRFVLSVFALLLSCFSPAFAAQPWEGAAFTGEPRAMASAAAAVKLPSQQDVVVLLEEYHVSFDTAGRQVYTHRLVYRIDTQTGVEDWAEISSEWEPWHQQKPEIRARVIGPDGVERKLDPKTLSEAPSREDQPEVYNDSRVYRGPLPGLSIGSLVEEETISTDTAPFFAGGVLQRIYVGRRVPVQHTRITLEAPSGFPLRYEVKKLSQADVKREESGGRLVVSVDQGPMEENTDDLESLPPEVIAWPQVDFASGLSWQSVADAYRQASEPKIRVADVEGTVGNVDASADRMATIRRLVALLHKDVRYTGLEFGESKLIPEFPGETLHRKYGDCKDKAALLVAMLRAAHIPAHLALLDAGSGEDVPENLAGMGLFDHAIVFVPGTPDLWIDATAEYTRVGQLPFSDQGRRALIIREGTAGLIRTPDAKPEDDKRIENREFYLAENGPARIVETSLPEGAAESRFRSFYSAAETDERRKGLEDYAKSTYLAEALTKSEHSDSNNMAQPFMLRLEMNKARRGTSDIDNSVAAIRYDDLTGDLPKSLRKDDEDEGKDEATGEVGAGHKPKPPRKEDYVFEPYMTEWRYHIVPAAGFQARPLPKNKSIDLGPAHFSQEFRLAADGTVDAVVRFNTGKGRYTVAEAESLRKALKDFRKNSVVSVAFDLTGQALLNAGKPKEAIQAYAAVIQQHPKEALHHVQLARALLSVGLAERAREEVRTAIALEPKSAIAYSNEGWILQHDLIGRRFAKGFDLQGAIAAYRKAKELDPKDYDSRADLAILLEHDASGVRYSPRADLNGAIAEYRTIDAESKTETLPDNLPYALFYAGRFSELKEELGKLARTDARNALGVAATAGASGVEAALDQAASETENNATRSSLLATATTLLLKSRHYPEAAGLLAAAIQGQENAGAERARAELLAQVKHYDTFHLDPKNPQDLVRRLFLVLLKPDATPEDMFPFVAKKVQKDQDTKDARKIATRKFSNLTSGLGKTGLLPDALADFVLSLAQISVEGDESLGYRLTIRSPGAEKQQLYVVKEDGEYRMVAGFNDVSAIGYEVRDRLAKNDLAGARHWLDWAREEQSLGGGDDPLSGFVFPHFWTKGQQGDAEAIRYASEALLVTASKASEPVDALQAGRAKATTDAARTNFDLALAVAYRWREDWKALQEAGKRLIAAQPDSLRAFDLLTTGYMGTRNWAAAEQLAADRLKRLPDDLDAIRTTRRIFIEQGQFEKARELTRPLIKNGKATANDLNEFAWAALFLPPPIDAESDEAGRNANLQTNNKSYAIMHTVACLYAAEGKAKEAQSLLLKVMELGNLAEPDDAVWTGMGLVAEAYGEQSAAKLYYERVEKPESTLGDPSSSYALAQMRLKALAGTK